MTERATRLPWRCTPGLDGYPDYWSAIVGPLDLSVRVPLRADNDHCWFVKREPNEGHPLRGVVPTLLGAQLAAEDAALAWLREGVEALGGRVLDASEVALVIGALENSARHAAEDYVGDEAELALARKMEAGRG